MTIKKQLFYSNLLMVVAPVVAFLVVGTIVGVIMNDLFSGSHEIAIADTSLFEMLETIDNSDANLLISSGNAQNGLLDEMAANGFHLRAEQDGEILFSNLNYKEQSYASQYISDRLRTVNQTLWVRRIDVNLLWHSVETSSSPITFIAVGSNNMIPFRAIGVDSFAASIPIFILIIALAVFIIILFSLFLANRMVKKITLPLDSLCGGAQRIQEGNLDEDIPCMDTVELDKVGGSFNEMQHRLKANIEKNEKYEQDRNEMLAGISHDLRTPLTSIKSYVKGLQDDVAKTPEKQREYLDVVYRKSCEMESLINQLFLFSKLKAGNLPFRFKLVSIQKYIVTVLDSLEYELSKNNIALTLNSACIHQKVRLDGEQMTRAITNILNNSVKYNPGKQLHIKVTLLEQDGFVRVQIQDDGVGVSDKQLSRLFDSFYRGDESRSNSTDGSGLGLAIAKSIVIAHNGRISAENHNGLTVIVELPIEKGNVE